MKKFFFVSVGVNLLGIILLTVFVFFPHWYFGLGSRPQLIMEFSLSLMVIGQISFAFVWRKKINLSLVIGLLPILIPIWYYLVIARPSIIAYM